MRRRIAAVAATFIAVASAGAQLTPADSARLRAQVATALLEFEWNSARPLSFRLGEGGGSIPDSLVPSSFTILGGAGGSRLIMESTRDIVEAKRIVNDHMLARGLRINEPWNPREEGFVFGSRSIGSSGRPVTEYCFGLDLISVTVRPQFAGRGTGSMILYRHHGNHGFCAPNYAPPERATGFAEADLEMPILRPPPGATSSGSGMGSGGRSGGIQRIASAEVRSEMSTGEIILFYAAQLSEQGWTVTQPAIVPEGAIVAARKKDKEGRDLQGVLADVKSPQGMHFMTLQIDRAAPARERRP